MSAITIIASITAKPEHQETVEQALFALVAASRQDEGCLQYDLHRDRQRPQHFMFYETWQDQRVLDAHLQTQHLQDFQQRVAREGLLEDMEMTLLERIA